MDNVDGHPRLAPAHHPAQRLATTLPATRTHGQSAFTHKRAQPNLRSTMPPAGLTPGWPQVGREGGGAPGDAGIPSHRRQACSRPGAGVEVVQPSSAPPRPPHLACYRTRPPTRRDTHSALFHTSRNKPPSCCLRAVTRGQQRSTAVHHGRGHPQVGVHHLAR